MAKSDPSQGTDVDASGRNGNRRLLSILEGRSCPSCSGTLERDQYKGKAAIVCTVCETPRVQVWTPSS